MDLDDLGLNPADLLFLEACDDCPASELELVTVRQGAAVDEAQAMKAHAESMVRRGFFTRVSSGGSASRLQGAKKFCVYRRTEAAEALLAAVRRLRELEALTSGETRACAAPRESSAASRTVGRRTPRKASPRTAPPP